MKIVINKCYGGFSVSEAVYNELGIKWDGYGYLDNEKFGIKDNNYMAYRTNDKLIAAVEKIGEEKASGNFAELRVVEIPDDIEWEIDEHNGVESVHEQHRSW